MHFLKKNVEMAREKREQNLVSKWSLILRVTAERNLTVDPIFSS